MPETALHTDGLEKMFGPVHAVIREQDTAHRTIDITDAQGISRTHAITWFVGNEGEIDDIRREVAEGALVGKTFRAHGFNVEKVPLIAGEVALPAWLQDRFESDADAAHVSIYEFWGLKGDKRVFYGIVGEIFHPDYLPTDTIETNLRILKSSGIIDTQHVLNTFLDYTNHPPRDRIRRGDL